MTNEFNKRQFLAIGASAAVGAGLGALATGAFFRPFGTNDSWGNDASNPQGGLTNPKSICLIFMSLRAKSATPPAAVGALDSALAWYRAAQFGTEPKTFALDELEKYRANRAWDTVPDRVPARASTDFEDFRFGGKSLIFIYVDDQPEVIFDEINLVQFTKYGHLSKAQEMNKNKSFRNAELFLTRRTNLPGEYLYLENHFKKFRNEDRETGDDDISNAHASARLRYSMNIHLKVKSARNVYIPLVVDPGTSNGGGWEP